MYFKILSAFIFGAATACVFKNTADRKRNNDKDENDVINKVKDGVCTLLNDIENDIKASRTLGDIKKAVKSVSESVLGKHSDKEEAELELESFGDLSFTRDDDNYDIADDEYETDEDISKELAAFGAPSCNDEIVYKVIDPEESVVEPLIPISEL